MSHDPWQLPRPQRGSPEHLTWLLACFEEASRRSGKPPYAISRPTLVATSQPTDVSWPNDRDLAAHGGMPRVRSLLRYEHDEHPEPAELGTRQAAARSLTYIRRLEREVGDPRHVVERLRDALADAIAANPPRITAKRHTAPPPASIDDAETVALISDTHYGLRIDGAEVPGSSYDWGIAARRTALYVSQVAAWKPHHRHVSRLRLLLGGDIIEGEIHGKSAEIDSLASQVDGARQILTASIDYLRQYYDRIEVVCAAGNHGRWPQQHGRAVAQKWDGLETVLYRGLEAVFRGQVDVSFTIPRSPFTEWRAPGGISCALTHGDTVFHGGSLGRSVNVEKLATQVRRWNAARADDIRVLAIGHYHTPLCTELDDGTVLVVNGSMCGTAPYAQSLGVHGSHPVQLLWESVPGHAVGDLRFVRLASADEDASLDAIVPRPTPIGEAG